MNNLLAFFITFSLFPLSLSAKALKCPDGEAKTYNQGTTISHWCEDDNEKNGPYEIYDKKQLIEKGSYKNDLKHGSFVRYHKGQVIAEGNYYKGTMNGQWKRFHKNGQLKDVGQWDYDSPIGIWYFYDEKGKITRKVNRSLENKKRGLLRSQLARFTIAGMSAIEDEDNNFSTVKLGWRPIIMRLNSTFFHTLDFKLEAFLSKTTRGEDGTHNVGLSISAGEKFLFAPEISYQFWDDSEDAWRIGMEFIPFYSTIQLWRHHPYLGVHASFFDDVEVLELSIGLLFEL